MRRQSVPAIREARRDDVPALAHLHVATFKETHGRVGAPTYELRERQWRAAFDGDASWFCYVAEDARGELVAFAKGTLHDGGVPGFAGELNKIYVLRQYRRQGIERGRRISRGLRLARPARIDRPLGRCSTTRLTAGRKRPK